MRHVKGHIFEVSKLIPQRQLASAKYDARQWVKEDARLEIVRAMMQHYKRGFPHAIEHIVQWDEQEVPWDYYALCGETPPPDYLPDLKITLAVIVEGFDVV